MTARPEPKPKILFDLEYLLKEEDEKSSSFCFCGGSDEVGRGPLAGPVVAATVLMTRQSNVACERLLQFLISLGVRDSKVLSAGQRQEVLKQLQINPAQLNLLKPYPLIVDKKDKRWSAPLTVFALAQSTNREIDRINILQASLKSMKVSFMACWKYAGIKAGKTLLLVDGKHIVPALIRCSPSQVEQRPVVKGDQKSVLIALASIIAKEYRDQYMKRMSEKYPGHGWERNAGYPTAAHRESIRKHGPTPLHRKSFAGVREYCQQTQ